MKKIALSGKQGNGKFALVDDKDFKILGKWKWYLNNGYVRRKYKGGAMFMHRFILNAPKGIQVDHVNLNTLDNTRKNIRLATHAENQHNRIKYKTNKSGYKGVFWNKESRKWRAEISLNGQNIFLGYFDKLETAAETYDKAAKKYFGKYARPNFLPSM